MRRKRFLHFSLAKVALVPKFLPKRRKKASNGRKMRHMLVKDAGKVPLENVQGGLFRHLFIPA